MLSGGALVLALSLCGAQPLEIPAELNPDGNISVWDAAEFAETLLANGTPEDLVAAQRLLEVVVSSQERRPGAAHRGNFLRRSDDSAIVDLNSVEFTLSYLIPTLIANGDKLPAALRESLLETIRFGLEEIRRMDVAITYTNVASMDCLNSCLGGELLNDTAMAERGYARLKEFTAITAANGTVFEYHSPVYMMVTMRSLHRLSKYVQDADTRVRARTMAARLALSAALRIHPGTGRLAGPHSRAKYSQVTCESEPERSAILGWIDEGAAPGWIGRVLDGGNYPVQIDETAVAGWSIGTTAYVSQSFALGVATREVSRQSNVFSVVSTSAGNERPAYCFSRYLIDDMWFGDPLHGNDRTEPPRLYEEGRFFGVQAGSRAICLYAPLFQENSSSFAPFHVEPFGSAKAVIGWGPREAVGDMWVGGRRIEALPAEAAPGDVVVVELGGCYVAARPLTITDMGCGAPIRLAESGGLVLLEMYNYLGPAKPFWEADRHGRFFQGHPQCGFYAEVAEKSAYADGEEFGNAVARGALKDEAQAPFTGYMDDAERLWSVEYSRDGQTLGIEIDLMQWRLKRRWTQAGDLSWPMLESPVARQNAEGRVEVGEAVLACGQAPAWLYANPAANLWVAGYHGEPAPFTLTVPAGSVSVESMGTGTVVWDNGNVTVEAVVMKGTPAIMGGRLVPAAGMAGKT